MILFSSQVFPTPGAAQSVFDFEPVDDEGADQSPDSDNLNESEDVLTIEELDEEKISQQQEQQEQAEEIVLEEDLTGETELNSLEKREKVEMLRYVENGFYVKMIEVNDAGLSVDTPEDLKRVEKYLNALH